MLLAPVMGHATACYLDRKQELEADNAIVDIDANAARSIADKYKHDKQESISAFGSLFANHPSQQQRAQNLERQIERKYS